MAQIKCIMMQRDETRLLEPWLRYHGYLFGYRNLTVIDHGSSVPAVHDVLERYGALGVTVERLDLSPRHFFDKGMHVARVIRALDDGEAYDFAMPLDCDEFVAVFNEDGLSSRREAIHAAFDALIGEQRALSVEMSPTNVIGRPGWFATGIGNKTFLPRGSVMDVDVGFHTIRSRLAEGRRDTPFCYLHFRNKPFAAFLYHARQKLELRVDIDDPAALWAYRGDGSHLVPYLFMSEAEYEAAFDDVVSFYAPDFLRLAAGLAIDAALFGVAFETIDELSQVKFPGWESEVFDGAAYIRANPDVGAAGLDPLYHYLRYGWREPRPLH